MGLLGRKVGTVWAGLGKPKQILTQGKKMKMKYHFKFSNPFYKIQTYLNSK
jgi:hypothetical protein